jgi:hypothetical protein
MLGEYVILYIFLNEASEKELTRVGEQLVSAV